MRFKTGVGIRKEGDRYKVDHGPVKNIVRNGKLIHRAKKLTDVEMIVKRRADEQKQIEFERFWRNFGEENSEENP